MTRFFVSYNRNDRQWAEWIAWQLEYAGHEAILQAWDFRPGSNFVEQMHDATTKADRTIAVLSPDYLASSFTAPEWQAAFRQDPQGEKGLLVPVRVREVERSGVFGSIVYVDLVGLDEQAARAALLEGIDPQGGKPATAPTFPGGAPATSFPEGAPAPGFPGPAPRKQSVLVDQAHGQGLWKVPPTIEQGFHRVAELAAKHGHPVRASTEKPLPPAAELEQYAVVVLANAPQGRFQLTDGEVDAVQRYVAGGGGLMALSTYTGDWHHGSNLNRVLEGFGLEFNRDLVMPATADVNAERDDGRRQVFDFGPGSAFTVAAVTAGDDNDQDGDLSVQTLSAGVRTVLTLSSCSVATSGDARAVLRSGADSKTFEPLPLGVSIAIDRWEVRRSGPATLLAVSASGAGRVAAVGGWKMFLDRFIERADYDNARLFENLLLWLAADG